MFNFLQLSQAGNLPIKCIVFINYIVDYFYSSTILRKIKSDEKYK